MTRNEFIDDITCFYDLKCFCEQYGLGVCDDYVDGDDLDGYIEDDINNCDYGWRSTRDSLNSIETGYSYYRCNGYFDYEGQTDEDFDELKQEVLNILDENGDWDPEEDEDDYEDDDEEDEPECEDDEYVYHDPVCESPTEDIPLEELFSIRPLKTVSMEG